MPCPAAPTPLPHVPEVHAVNGNRIQPPFPEGLQTAVFGAGCFWGVEKVFWETPGVYSTAAGYAGGYTPNPTYEEVCSARTGHTEAVLVVFDPAVISYEQLLKVFWEDHDPTQGMRQGNDVGTQYRSAIYVDDAGAAGGRRGIRDAYQERLTAAGYGEITTEIAPLGRSTTPRTTTSSTSTRCPNGYCPVHRHGRLLPGRPPRGLTRVASPGMEALRTPDARFTELPDFPFEPRYVEVPDGDGAARRLRGRGPGRRRRVLLLHGEPSWSFLYRRMIPVLTAPGSAS